MNDKPLWPKIRKRLRELHCDCQESIVDLKPDKLSEHQNYINKKSKEFVDWMYTEVFNVRLKDET